MERFLDLLGQRDTEPIWKFGRNGNEFACGPTRRATNPVHRAPPMPCVGTISTHWRPTQCITKPSQCVAQGNFHKSPSNCFFFSSRILLGSLLSSWHTNELMKDENVLYAKDFDSSFQKTNFAMEKILTYLHTIYLSTFGNFGEVYGEIGLATLCVAPQAQRIAPFCRRLLETFPVFKLGVG